MQSNLITLAMLLFFGADPSLEPAAKTPEESLRCIRTHRDFQVELVAAEPLVADPIAIAFGPDAKLWVVEMGGYPNGTDQAGNGQGKIRFLEDTDHDGNFERSVVFLDGLSFPTGVLPWRKGVLVTCAPDIFYAEDTDGDGKADRREVLFSGFVEKNPQHRVNGLRFGLDNWVYCANGDNGGVIKSVGTGRKVDIRNRDFRIRPDQGDLDLQLGMSQFSRCRDDWGNWFGGNSVFPFWHCVLADHYLRRNTQVVSIDPCVNLMDPPMYGPVHTISAAAPRYNEPHSVNRFTSACGADVYRDELFGSDFAHSYFVCEPTHNLVRCEIMTSHGATFKSRALLEGDSEFVASTDNWFRPTQVRTGPDGALWIVDMYRLVIEHPDFIPPSRQKGVKFRSGQGQGRIYRVSPVAGRRHKMRRLDQLNIEQLVAALDSPNGPQRDMIQQLLVERRDRKAIPLLETLVTDSKRASCRLHALCTLDGLHSASSAIICRALRDPHPGVRRHAIRIGEPRLSESAELQTSFLQLIDDPDASVRLQLACSLGEWGELAAGRALGQIAHQDVQDPFIEAAVMSSATNHHEDLLASVIKQGAHGRKHSKLITDLLIMALDADRPHALASGLRHVASTDNGSFAPWQFDVLAGLLDSLSNRNTSLRELYDESGDDLRAVLRSLDQLFEVARHVVADEREPTERRVHAAPLLGRGFGKQEQDSRTLAGLLIPQSDQRLQEAAVRALGRLHIPIAPQLMLAGWQHHSPSLRVQILDEMVRHHDWIVHVLDRIESQQIAPETIGLRHRGPLILHTSGDVRRRASAVFGKPIDKSRRDVIRRYQGALQMQGDRGRGKAIFQKQCSICHVPTDSGVAVGPDLWALTDRSGPTMLTGILDPNLSVDPRFISYTTVMTNGLIHTGILFSEAGNSIILIDAQGKRRALLRTQIDELRSNGKSLMPVGFETEIPDPQSMADLIAYLSADDPTMTGRSGTRKAR